MKRKPMWMRVFSWGLVLLMFLQSLPFEVWAASDRDAEGAPGVFAGEPLPVDLRTGAVVLAVDDFRVGHDSLPLALGRVYRSDMDQSEPGIFGHKWHSLFDMRVVRDGDALSLRDEQGRPRAYTPRDGAWVSVKHEYEAIRRNADGEWERHLKSGVVYRFDAEGRLAEITDPNGRFIRITRLDNIEGPDDATGRAIRLEDRYGRFITVSLGENGRALTAQNSAGRRCVYLHDEQGNLKAFIDHAGGTMAMKYDGEHRLTEMNGAVGYTLAYGKDGRIAAQSTERGMIARYDYTSGNDSAVVCRITDTAGAVSRFAFAADGQVTVTDPTGVAESLWLNDRELPVKAVSANGQTAEIRYDERANPVEIRGNGVATRLTYAPDNTLNAVESDTGASLTFAYDARRNVTAVENQRGARSVFEWDKHGLLRSAKESAGSSVTLDYDAHGQVNAIRTGDGQTIALNFDALGLLRGVTTPTGVDFRYAYDLAGRLTGVENSEGQRVRLERDDQGRVVRVLDAAGNLTRMDYDPAGLLTLVRDPVGAVTRLDYDALGRTEAYTDSNENGTRWTYDAAGRLLGEVDALGEAATLAYDAQGRLSREVNRRGQATAIRYDDAGRMAGFEQAGAPAAFAYDAYGRTIGMSNADSDFAFSLTPDDLIERVTDRKAGLAVAYEYDTAGRRVGMTAGDETVRYAYDAHGRLGAIASSAGRVSFEYDAHGRRSAMQYPNGVRTSYTYDKLNRIVEIRAVEANGPDVSRFRYTYDVLGNRTQMIEGEDRIVNYTYDAVNRLVRVAEVDRVTEYIYDNVGNRVNVIVDGVREDYFTGKDNRVLKAGAAEFEYDADGNMTARTTADGRRYAYRYDAANRLIEAKGPEGTVAYAYAANGARVTRTEDGETTRFVFDHEDVVFEVVDGNVTTRYLHGPGIDEPLALKRGEDIAFYHADALGSVHRLSGSEGAPVSRYRYDAFGRMIEADSAIANTFTYTGREWDSAADLYFYRARFLNPDIGRFTAKDPLGLVPDANQYVYCFNSPLNYTDPTGEIPLLLVPLAFGVKALLAKGAVVVTSKAVLGFAAKATVGGSIDLGIQLSHTGGDLSKIDWWSVGGSGASTGLLGVPGAGKITGMKLLGTKAVGWFGIGAIEETGRSWSAGLSLDRILGSGFVNMALGLLSEGFGRGLHAIGGKHFNQWGTHVGHFKDGKVGFWGSMARYGLKHWGPNHRAIVNAETAKTAASIGLKLIKDHYTRSGQTSSGTHQSPGPLTTTPDQWPSPYKWPAPLRW